MSKTDDYMPADLGKRLMDKPVSRRVSNYAAGTRLEALRIAKLRETEKANEVIVKQLGLQHRIVDVTYRDVCEAVVEHFETRMQRLLGPDQSKPVIYARHIAFYLCDMLCGRSTHDLGKWFGRDHSTICYALRKLRLRLTEGNIEADALRMSINAILVLLARKHGWIDG